MPGNANLGRIFLIRENNRELIKAIAKQKYKIVCLNDEFELSNFEVVKAEMIEAFDKILPIKSDYEIERIK